MVFASQKRGSADEDDDEPTLGRQEQAFRRARKQAREQAEVQAIIGDARGQRSAKKKALENTVWLEAEGKKRSSNSAPESRSARHAEDSHKSSDRKRQKRSEGDQNDTQTSEERESTGRRNQQTSVIRRTSCEVRAPQQARQPHTQGFSQLRQHPSDSDEFSDSRRSKTGDSSRDELDASDDEDKLINIPDKDVAQMFEQEGTTIIGNTPIDSGLGPANLFDDNIDVEMASNRSLSRHRSRSRGSSTVSRPPTSKSKGISGQFDQSENDDEDFPPRASENKCPRQAKDTRFRNAHVSYRYAPQTSDSEGGNGSNDRSFEKDDEDEDLPMRVAPRGPGENKKSDKRQAKFRDERPVVSASKRNTADIPVKKSTKRTHDLDSQQRSTPEDPIEVWPSHTSLRAGGLLQQNTDICKVCRDAIQILETTLITKEAWPKLHHVAEYRVEVLSEAVKGREAQDPRYRDIRWRIKKDERYTQALGRWVIDQLPLARGRARADGLDHIAVFQLGMEKTCVERVKALIESDLYVYPGQWEVDRLGNPKWVVKAKEIYLNSGIINILRSAFFATPGAIGFKYKDLYVSSHPNRPEPELTISLVALASTGLHAALDAWRTGTYMKKAHEKFDGDTYKSVFDRHVRYLEALKVKNINAFHSIMSDLYVKVIGEGEGKDSQMQGDALAVLDLSGFD